MQTKGLIILSGVVGSHAYGLNHENSDIDLLGVFINPTESYWSLEKPPETEVQLKPDITYHEIEKFLKLCLNCNPTVMELLWLKDYEVIDELGLELLKLRYSFFSTERVINAYGGYAYSQMKKIQTAGAKRPKYIRHCFRLLEQGRGILETGNLSVTVKDPEKYKALESMGLAEINKLFEQEYQEFKSVKSVLSDQPNVEIVNRYLYNIRSCILKNRTFIW